MEPWLQTFITIVGSVIASSGFWAYLQRRMDRRDGRTEMLIGLAHDRIMYLGMFYIERQYITRDEYENLNDYLYKPYKKIGGNGSADRVMAGVNGLPIRRFNQINEEETK